MSNDGLSRRCLIAKKKPNNKNNKKNKQKTKKYKTKQNRKRKRKQQQQTNQQNFYINSFYSVSTHFCNQEDEFLRDSVGMWLVHAAAEPVHDLRTSQKCGSCPSAVFQEKSVADLSVQIKATGGGFCIPSSSHGEPLTLTAQTAT